MAVFRVDWPFIRDTLRPGVDYLAEQEIVLLPAGGADILLSVIADRLQWQATYRTGDYDYSDWDLLRKIGTATEQGLMNRMLLTDLRKELDDIEAAIYATACCAGGTVNGVTIIGTDPAGDPGDVPVGTGDPPQSFQDNPLADYDSSGTIGWDDYAVYLCDAGHRLAATLGDWMARIQFATSTNAFALARDLVVEFGERLFPGPDALDLYLLLWDELYNWAEALGAWLTGQPSSQDWDGIWNAWHGGVRDDVICAVAQATSADAAAAEVESLMQSLFAGPLWSAIWSVYPFGRSLRKIMAGAQAYEGPYACDCPDPLVAGYNAIPLAWDTNWTQTLNTNGLTDLGDFTYRFTGNGSGANYKTAGSGGFGLSRDLSGWTVDHIGWYVEVDAQSVAANLRTFAAIDVNGTPPYCRGYWGDFGGGVAPTQTDVDAFCNNMVSAAAGEAINAESMPTTVDIQSNIGSAASHTFDFRIYVIVHLTAL